VRTNRRKSGTIASRIPSIDFLRGVVIVIMALDHIRMYFGQGTWYTSPTDLASTTPLLFFTRWITHFCAPAFLFLAGTSAYLYGSKKESLQQTAWFLFSRGLWLVIAEVIIVSFGWTFDPSYSFVILQVIWAIGVSMMVLAGLIFLPTQIVFMIGILLVFGHNLLDPVTVQGTGLSDYLWYILHQPRLVILDERAISIFYPVLPWLGLMALGYVAGNLYRRDFPPMKRLLWLVGMGIGATLLFILLRQPNGYGEPTVWREQESAIFTLISFLNTTKYPPSLHFLLMTMGPAQPLDADHRARQLCRSGR
jgi:uncharacterized membrane protein